MRIRINIKIVIAIVFLLVTWSSTALAQVAVIANRSVPLDTIKKSELLDFYTQDIKKWQDQQPVVVFDFKPKGEVRRSFYEFIGKSSSRMKSIWLKKMLSGEGDPPEAIKSEEELLKKVASTAGSIGFVNKTKVTPDVKILVLIDLEKK